MIGRWLSDLPMDDPARKSTSKPMLRRFILHTKPIKYLHLLGSGTEGVVYRVEIEGKEYAIKVFRNWTYTGTKLKGRAQHYTFPIANEARAFARLDSIGQNGTWAVKCHGWMKISGRQRLKSMREYTCWAIVKDYLPHPVSISDIPEIRRKMKIARKALIHPSDTQPCNYRDSFFVDLGRVKTHPYPPQMWSNRERREFFTWFDGYASRWEVSVRDGSVVEGWLNQEFKRSIAEVEARNKRDEAAKQRKLLATVPDATADDQSDWTSNSS
ncbi:predicted protein [Uncinocarpus reesii 1704]|uniref:Protein kinase domain-containing protein n=1 Tax=Uncinocarpus reesii (strain UAMH 1704) TaxID=336963 RepID=C4JU88_UNCRE|nr:uncharacterized protein UREG_06027 [Uncinocarpus reesii 1704]EEP81185.1 predicted protein [Uncinocarpus reesii 1704]